jgi:hypothetical protein
MDVHGKDGYEYLMLKTKHFALLVARVQPLCLSCPGLIIVCSMNLHVSTFTGPFGQILFV